MIRVCARVVIGIVCAGLGASPAAAEDVVASDAGAVINAAWVPTAALAAADGSPAVRRDQPPVEGTGASSFAYPWRGPRAEQPDWQGARRDAAYFFGYQFVTVAVLYSAPQSISGWTAEDKANYSFSKWRTNVTNPVVMDGDKWWVNNILHPYWGGTYYIRGRERGLDHGQSFLLSALMSTMYEYGAEALFEPVSVQDLVVTPVIGSLVGEYIFSPLRERIRAKPGQLGWWDKAVLTFTDPLGVLNAEVDRFLGIKTTLRLQSINTRMSALAPATDGSTAGVPRSARRPAPAWGVQLRAVW